MGRLISFGPPEPGQPARSVALGRSRFGGGRRTMLLLTLGGALLASAALSVGLCLLVEFKGSFLWSWFNVTLTLWLVCIPAAWFLLVDRTSLAKAPTLPEETVESGWTRRAQAGAFQDMLVLGTLLVAVPSLLRAIADIEIPWDMPLTFAGFVVVATLDFGLRYYRLKKAEG